jgi:hypothetical protein
MQIHGGCPQREAAVVVALESVASDHHRQIIRREVPIDGSRTGKPKWPRRAIRVDQLGQVRLLHANLCALAANFADAEITPLIDAVIADRERLDFFLQTLAPRRVLLVVLTPTAEVCRSRNEGRPPESQFFFDGHEALMAAMREEFGTIGWWFDTSDRSLDETVQQVTSVAHILAETRP